MLASVVFTKDRPLQLESYLESYKYCISENIKDEICIVCDSLDKYREIKSDGYDFVEDKNDFHKCIIELLTRIYFDGQGSKYVLFGCDDCVWIRQFHMKNVSDVLDKNENLLGFSLRLGHNILPKSVINFTKVNNEFCTWDYKKSSSHFGYPIDLMGSVYRIKDIIDALLECKTDIKSPNYLESYLTNYFLKSDKYNELGCFNSLNNLVAQDCNRVQSDFPNKFTGTENETAESLQKLYLDGHEIIWQDLLNIVPEDVFVGNKYLKTRKKI